MTYSELSKIKTTGWTTNHVIDDVLNNGRFCYTKKEFPGALVPASDLKKIKEWAEREGVTLPNSLLSWKDFYPNAENVIYE